MRTGINPYAARTSEVQESGGPVRKVVVSEAPKESEVNVTAQASETEAVPAGSISEVMGWVDGDAERASVALESEKAGLGRKTLVRRLEEIVAGPDTEDVEDVEDVEEEASGVEDNEDNEDNEDD